MIFILKGIIAVVAYVAVLFLIKKVKNERKQFYKMLFLIATLVFAFFMWRIIISAIPYFAYLIKIS